MPTINSPTPDATTTSKGKVQLAGILGGTAASPTLNYTASWTTPTLNTNWAAFDSGTIPTTTNGQYRFPRYHKDPMGYVHITGLAKNSSASALSSAIFTLPTGFRPGHTQRIGTLISDNPAELDIEVDGTIHATGTSSVPAAGWISLNNLHFLAEQ